MITKQKQKSKSGSSPLKSGNGKEWLSILKSLETLLASHTPQETALAIGDAVYVVRDEDPAGDGVGTRLGTVAEIDLGGGYVVIKQGTKTATLRPTAVFRDQVVPNEALEDALLAFGEHVRDHGFPTEGPFARAADLLLRRRPRLAGAAAGDALRRPDEDLPTAALRVCRGLDGAVLPVQGPPGTGKSYTGGRTIAALAAAHRVGITAVSHKVIDHLLQSVHEGSKEAGRRVRLVHKHDDVAPNGIEYLKDNDEALAAIAHGTVVGGTAWMWALSRAEGRLDYLFVDEAG